MYLMVTQRKYKNRIYRHAKIVEGMRVNGKVVHKTIKSLGPVKSGEDLRRANDLLEHMKKGGQLVALKDIGINGFQEYGNVYVCERMWNSIAVNEIMGEVEKGSRTSFDFERVIFSLTVNRLSNPESENGAYEWIKKDAWIEGKDKIEKQHLYRSLDLLVKNKEGVEKSIFEKLKTQGGIMPDKVFYDLTSSYFEGNTCLLAEFGYSRDKKRGKKQLVLGIVLADGLPIAHFVFPGSTTDKKTLKQTVDYLKTLGIKKIMFVSDRGLMSDENIRFLDEASYEYIIATKRRVGNEIRRLMLSELSEKDAVKEGFYVKEVMKTGRLRFILYLNKKRAEEDRENLDLTLNEIKERYKEYYGKKLDDKQSVILKTKLRGYARLFRLNENLFEVDKKAYEYEKGISGRFLLVTTTKLSPGEVAETYKQLNMIEQSFREIKSFIELRPFHHQKERRIRSHIFVCVLALLLECLIQKRLSISVRKAMKELKRIKIAQVEVNGEVIGVLNELSPEQKEIFKQLGIEEPYRIV